MDLLKYNGQNTPMYANSKCRLQNLNQQVGARPGNHCDM